MSSIDTMSSDLEEVLSYVEGLSIDVDVFKDEVVDESTVDWYKGRVAMLLGDDCPEAVNAYLHRLYKDDSINAATHLFCLKAIMDLQTEYYDKKKKER